MKLAQLTHVVIGQEGDKGRSVRRLGPRRVTAMAGVNPDTGYALQELLHTVQALAQGEFQGDETMQAEARSLASDLARLGAGRNNLLRPMVPVDIEA
jgi:hypothetical protein